MNEAIYRGYFWTLSLDDRTVNRGPAFAACASVINRASGPSIVVTCGRTKLPPSKTIYIHRRRGWRIVFALCRSEADPVGDQPVILPYGGSHISPSLSGELLYLPFSKDARIGFWYSCRTPRVGAIAALIITTRGTRSLSWDSVL